MREHIIINSYFVFYSIVEYVRNNIRQIRLRHHFFPVAELYYALGNLFKVIIRKLDTELLQVVFNIRFSAGLPQGVSSLPAERLGHKIAEIKLVFLTADGLYT